MEHHRPTAGEAANANASDDARNSWSGGAIPGQQIGLPVDTVDNTPEVARYTPVVEGLYEANGQWSGLVGLDYEGGQDFTVDKIKAAGKLLKNYWGPRDEYVDTVAGTYYTEGGNLHGGRQ